jgi:catechol 2,3-dioxygenase-like lactoylglutathione lyase family enzyme
MAKYTYDHIHLRTRDPMGMAEYFHKMFDAKVLESVQSDGRPRVDLDIDGLIVFIAPVAPDADIAASPPGPYLGLDHFGFRVDSVDETVAELKRRGADIIDEPRTIRPGVRIAFVRAPDDVRIELLQRDEV